MFRFQVDLLGSCRVARCATGDEVAFRTRKTRLLLGLLLLSPGSRMNREQLASLLWDPAPETLARSSLRQALRELKDVLGPEGEDVIDADRFTVGLKAAAFDLDVRRFKELLVTGSHDQAALIAAANLWQGELFGPAQPSAPVFEAWLQIERSQLRSVLTTALTDQLEKLIALGTYADTRIAEELVRIEPSHELAHQFIMRFHAQRGDQSAALRQYGLLEQALAEELDSEPSEASNELLVAIKSGEVSLQRAPAMPVSPAPARSRNGPPRITIRPPLTRYVDGSKDYLGEGFAFLAKSCLSRFRCWIVIPWPSSGFESATAVDFTAVGQVIDADFAVDCVLDWRTGDGKLFVTLIDCRDGSEVWSALYPVGENELQEVSSSVAGAVAANLASQVNHITLLRHARSTPGNPVAYDLWLKGHQLSRLWTAEADAEAEAMFLKAIELDPGLAGSHASLAQVLCSRSLVRPGYPNRKADCAAAFRHAREAIALDPYDPRCHISMAWNWLIAKSPERANTHFRMAVDLNPNDAEALIAAACGLAFLGHIQDAKGLAEKAVQMNPVYPEYYTDYLSAIQFLDGDYEATIETVEKCYEGFPDRAALAAAAWALQGHIEKAEATYQYFTTLTSSKWEGPGRAEDVDLERWIMEVLPIHWPKGQQTLLKGLRLARQMAEQA
ncbi:BTAD domain-containing putative transcriptional regulator [Rhodobacter sp. SY28-1]|uniref:BTAD domain-containing putative transcriptional regulator n=1 Tax=Rhodobacter sp. SY28-1 TaxID=2562317 RepID=UPI0010BFF542|nr:BTAD domain-containing putative transcriptional regulator [Rhodobacter sp. SY28-1]